MNIKRKLTKIFSIFRRKQRRQINEQNTRYTIECYCRGDELQSSVLELSDLAVSHTNQTDASTAVLATSIEQGSRARASNEKSALLYPARALITSRHFLTILYTLQQYFWYH